MGGIFILVTFKIKKDVDSTYCFTIFSKKETPSLSNPRIT